MPVIPSSTLSGCISTRPTTFRGRSGTKKSAASGQIKSRYQNFVALKKNLIKRIEPYVTKANTTYDISLNEYLDSKRSGWPFSSWQQVETVNVFDSTIYTSESGSQFVKNYTVPIAADGSHPRRMSLFVANVVFYWLSLLIAAYFVRRLTHRRWRSAAAGFPIELVEKEDA